MGEQQTETSLSTIGKHADNLSKQENPFKTRKAPPQAADRGDAMGGPTSALST